MNAIILCSGPGSRMKPWTDTKNKCLFKVNGEPLLDYHIRMLIENGIRNIIVTHKDGIDASQYVLECFYRETELLGSGGACKEILNLRRLDRSIIIYGDTYFESNIYALLPGLYTTDKNYILTEQVGNRTTGLINSDFITGKIDNISEKGNIKANGRNAGIMILNKNVLNKDKGDLMTDVLPGRTDLYAQYIAPDGVDIGIMDNYIRLTLDNYDNKKVNELLELYPDSIQAIKKILYAERIFICGNGGSLSTANHIALDWSKVGKKEVIPITGAEHISAYGNDTGYKNVFLNQLKRHKVTEKDVIVLISTSGTSPNIVKTGIYYSHIPIVLFTGSNDFVLKTQYRLPVNSKNIRVIEDTHLAYGHVITEILGGLV